MKRMILRIACVLALCVLLSVCACAASDGYLVQIPDSKLPFARAQGVELEPACDDIYLLRSERDLNALRSAGIIVYAEPNEPISLTANSWNIDAVHAASAWNHQNEQGQYDRLGDGVVIAIVDSGVQADHTDLNPENILPYKDYGSNENGVDIWHGTFVAGIIAAQMNDQYIDGVAPNVKLLPVTITSDGKSDTFTAIRGIEYAASQGVDVINLSIGGDNDSLLLERACKKATQSGAILVAAAGNYKSSETPDEKNIIYPAGYDFVVSVSGCKQTVDGPVFDGDYSYFNSKVDVCAPGSKIRSLYLNSTTAVASGTSFAAPTVSAMAAIAKQVNPAIDTETFLALLEATSTDLGDPGRDVYYGMGFVNMEAFIEKLDEQYAIHYVSEVDPAQIDGELPTSYTIADGEITLPTLSRPGWRFLGWYEDPEFNGTPVSKIPAASMGERSYYAKWETLPNEPPAVTASAPAEDTAAPASLDGLTSATPYGADVASWFTDPDGDPLTFTLVSGPGSLEGTVLTYTPGPDDAQTEVPLTVRADDGFGHTAEHTVTIRVGPRPASQPVLTDPSPVLVNDPPAELSMGLTLYDSRVTGVRLGEQAVGWRMEDGDLIVTVPAADEGDYTLTIEFDAGEPVSRTVQVRLSKFVYVRADAPAEASATPASLDGVTSATPYAADVSAWFAEPNGKPLTYEKTAGPGSLTGSNYVFTPAAADANSDVLVSIRASDGSGHSAEHSLTILVGLVPASQPVLADPEDRIALDLCRAPASVPVDLILYGAEVTAVRLGETALTWTLKGKTLSVDIPDLGPGEYEVTIEFDAGQPIVWPWHVYYGVSAPETTPDAPAVLNDADADVSTWFAGEALTYSVVSGPGSLDGSILTADPDVLDAEITVRAEDPYGRSAEHTVQIEPNPPVLTCPDSALYACDKPRQIECSLVSNGLHLVAMRLGTDMTLFWSLDGQRLTVDVPALDPGDYTLCLEFDNGASLSQTWHVRECPSAAFTDVRRGVWYHSAVDWAVENGLMNGMAADRFAPDGEFTRAMLVTVLYRAAGSPDVPDGSPFADVVPGKYYSKAVAWAAAEGIVNGMAPGRFAPDAPITREQLVTILYRWAGDDGVRADLSAFPDAGTVSSYAKDAMAWAVGHGIVNGVGSGGVSTLSPKDGASRAQVAAIMMRYLTNVRPTEVSHES